MESYRRRVNMSAANDTLGDRKTLTNVERRELAEKPVTPTEAIDICSEFGWPASEDRRGNARNDIW